MGKITTTTAGAAIAVVTAANVKRKALWRNETNFLLLKTI